MADPAKTPILRPLDSAARGLARGLLAEARFGALAVMLDGAPFVSRIALGFDGGVVSLVSTLSQHTQALKAAPRCSLLVGEPGPKGDPLTHARLTLQAEATFLDHDTGLRARWLDRHPKARLYIDFGDFRFVRFSVRAGFLNGGFGNACKLTPADMGLG